MKRVLVTGSAGFLGSHFVDHVIATTDWDIVGLDSFFHRGDSLRVYQDPKRYAVYTHDLSTPISARLADKIGPIDYVANLASESHVDRSINDPVPFVMNNVSLALTMLEYARIIKPAAFVQMSTDETLGPAIEGLSHKEWDPVIPSNPYAASKAAQEAIAISYWRTYSVPVSIVNGMNLFGQRQDREKYLPLLISKIQSGETVTVHGSENYIGKRTYMHARSVADAICFLIKNKSPSMYSDGGPVDRPDRFHIAGDIELDNLQLANMVAEILRKPLKYELRDFHLARFGHDRRYHLDASKIKHLGWHAPVDFEASLRSTISWYLENPEWLK